MARSARLILPKQPHLIFHQGNNQQVVFYDEQDKAFYLEQLKEASRQYQVDIHAYVLLEHCIYLLASPFNETGLACMMQWMGRCYVPWFNHKYQRSGTLWEGRFKTSVVEAERYLMICSRFIEMRPVMQGIVEYPENYKWSSYCHHIGVDSSLLIRDHALYWQLGNTPFARETVYQAFINSFNQEEDERLKQILTKGWPLGSRVFMSQLEKMTGRSFRLGKKGRPPKTLK